MSPSSLPTGSVKLISLSEIICLTGPSEPTEISCLPSLAICYDFKPVCAEI